MPTTYNGVKVKIRRPLAEAVDRAGSRYRAELLERAGPISLMEVQGALAYSGSRPERKPYAIRNGVAVVCVHGYLTNSAWWWDETEYSQIECEVKMAMADPDVRGVVLDVDSFGGEALNAFETRDNVVQARSKPLWAVAAPVAYSGAYLMATAAERVYAPPVTGGVGSIGVYAQHTEYSEYLEKAGVKVTLVSAGEGKTDGNPYEPLSKGARESIEKDTNRIYGEFVARVAGARRMNSSAVIALGAHLYTGPDAVKNGLADKIGSLDQAIDDMVAVLNGPTILSSMAEAAVHSQSEESEVRQMAETNTAVETKAPPVDNSAAIAAAKAEGKAELMAQQHEIRELCAIFGKPELAAEYADKSVADVRAALLEERVKEQESAPTSSHIAPESGLYGKPAESLAQRMKAKLKREGRLYQ